MTGISNTLVEFQKHCFGLKNLDTKQYIMYTCLYMKF